MNPEKDSLFAGEQAGNIVHGELTFFDFVNLENPKDLWIVPQKELADKILANREFESTLYKTGKKIKQWIARQYIIHGNYLAYLKV